MTKKLFHKINISLYNSLIGIDRIHYLIETEIFLEPFRDDDYLFY